MKDVFCSEEEVQTRGVHFTTEEDTFLEDGSEWKHYAGAIERHGELSVWRRLRTIKICRLVEEQMVVVAGFTGKEGKMAINMADEMIRELREKKRMRERKEKGTTKLMDTHMSAQRAVEFETWMKDIEEDRFQEIEDAVYATEGKEALDVGDWCDGVDEEDIDMYVDEWFDSVDKEDAEEFVDEWNDEVEEVDDYGGTWMTDAYLSMW